MTQARVATPTQNYLENEDLVFEIGDEETETRKKRGDDDHLGYGHETEPEEEDIVEEDDDIDDEFSDFDWAEEGDVAE